MFTKKSLIGALVAAGIVAGPALTAPRSVVKINDVTNEILSYARYSVFDDVSIGVNGTTVVLEGKVTMPYKADDIARRVASVAGVQQVINNIAVLPVSRFDDNLRWWLAHAIYDHPAFVQYASMSNPPIHIVVDGGHVVLTGVVNNEVERTLAYAIARSSIALSVRNELKTDAEMARVIER